MTLYRLYPRATINTRVELHYILLVISCLRYIQSLLFEINSQTPVLSVCY